MMDANLHMKAVVSVIGSCSDFAYKWASNAGLQLEDALRLSLAVSEVVTDIVQYAYPGEDDGEFDIEFKRSLSNVEVIIREKGEPFDPDMHKYDRKNALESGIFTGAGFQIVRHLVDDFVFVNKGHEGKEFRLFKRIVTEHIVDIFPEEHLQLEKQSDEQHGYTIEGIKLDDAEDISKLIYRTYKYSYPKEAMYFPRKIELALIRKEKLGVIAKTRLGYPVGYFAILRTTDSLVGEVGEAVVSEPHRRRGLMKRMLKELISIGRQNGLLGVFGQAVTTHIISQKANYRFNFKSTALLLAEYPPFFSKSLTEEYPQPVSDVHEYLTLSEMEPREVYLPKKYQHILEKIYENCGIPCINHESKELELKHRASLKLDIHYEEKTATIVVQNYGKDFLDIVNRMINAIIEKKLNSVFIDLPLHKPQTPHVVEALNRYGFIFCGLMPLMHKEHDYLRMQRIFVDLDFDLMHIFSDMGKTLKKIIQEEWYDVRNNRSVAGSTVSK